MLQIIQALVLMLIFEDPVWSISTTDWLRVTAHSLACALGLTMNSLSTIICGVIISSLISSLTIPTGIFLQWTASASIQKQKTNGVDILGGLLVLFAVILVPGYQFYKERQEREKKTDEAIKIIEHNEIERLIATKNQHSSE